MKTSTRMKRIERIIARGMGKNWSARFIARLVQQEIEHQYKELMNMAEGDCVRILTGIHKDKSGLIVEIERQNIMVQIEGIKDPVPFTRLQLEAQGCPDAAEIETELGIEPHADTGFGAL